MVIRSMKNTKLDFKSICNIHPFISIHMDYWWNKRPMTISKLWSRYIWNQEYPIFSKPHNILELIGQRVAGIFCRSLFQSLISLKLLWHYIMYMGLFSNGLSKVVFLPQFVPYSIMRYSYGLKFKDIIQNIQPHFNFKH